MELKHAKKQGKLTDEQSLNCTVMELKLTQTVDQDTDGSVLIVPLWN